MLSFFIIFARLGQATVRSWRSPAFRGTLLLTGLTLVSGTVFYATVEGWSWVDAAYFSIATLSTVGYGDLHPETTTGKVFTMAYIVVGVGVFVALITQIADALLRRPDTPA